MKKAIPVVVLAAVIVATVVHLRRGSVSTVRAVELAPADTLVFLHLPDLKRSAQRWPKTAMAQIAQEPDMQAFLERPRSNLPQWVEFEKNLARLKNISPGEAFVAVTSVDQGQPKVLSGFTFDGSHSEAFAFVSDLRSDLMTAWTTNPDGSRHDVEKIRWFESQGRGGWYLVSNDEALMNAAVARLKGAKEGEVLAKNDVFATMLTHVPSDADVMVYAPLGTLAEQTVGMLASVGFPISPETTAEWKKAKALSYGLKMDGTQFRETTFIFNPAVATEEKLPLHALALSSATTSLLYAGSVPTANAMSESTQAMLAMLPAYRDFEKALTAAGTTPAELGKVFGPEFGAVLDWPADAAAPSFAITLDVRDGARAKAVVETLASGTVGGAAWVRTDRPGAIVISQPSGASLFSAQPTIALTDQFAVMGLSPDGIALALARVTSGQERLGSAPAYQAATKLVSAPTSGFVYLDLKTLFERIYGLIRPFVGMALAFQPEAGKYFDAGKLPDGSVVSQHLGPVVYANSTTKEGTLLESAGPLTINQLAALMASGAMGGSASSMSPLTKGGPLDLKGLGGLGLPFPGAPADPSPKTEPPPSSLPTLEDPKPPAVRMEPAIEPTRPTTPELPPER